MYQVDNGGFGLLTRILMSLTVECLMAALCQSVDVPKPSNKNAGII